MYNISSGSGEVKLFETEQAMQADPNPSEGDLAVVYREELTAVNENSEFDSCTFPNTVTLDEVFSDSIYGSFRSTGGGWFDGTVDMSSSSFRFDGYGEGDEIRVEYTSNDGITYTRTDGGEELQEFGATIKWDDGYGDFNSVIGNFMKIGGSTFEGIFKSDYAKKIGYYVSTYDNIVRTASNGNSGDITLNVSKFDVTPYISIILQLYSDINIEPNSKPVYLYLINNELYARIDTPNIGGLYYLKGDRNTNQFRFRTKDTQADTINIYKLNEDSYQTININTDKSLTCIYNNVTSIFTELLNITMVSQFYIIDSIPVNYNNDCFNDIVYFVNGGTPQTVINERTKVTDKLDLMYILAKTQLDTTADYVYEKTFYGKNGVEIGSLQDITDLTLAQFVKRVKIYNRYKNLAMSSSVDSIYYAFWGNKDIIEVPYFDTSNVTSFSGAFGACTNLTTVPILNTSGASSLYQMFYNCTNLTNESLNNILRMCISAVGATTKTLKNVGLTSEQAAICQGLSNYGAFIAAGWTTGY